LWFHEIMISVVRPGSDGWCIGSFEMFDDPTVIVYGADVSGAHWCGTVECSDLVNKCTSCRLTSNKQCWQLQCPVRKLVVTVHR